MISTADKSCYGSVIHTGYVCGLMFYYKRQESVGFYSSDMKRVCELFSIRIPYNLIQSPESFSYNFTAIHNCNKRIWFPRTNKVS